MDNPASKDVCCVNNDEDIALDNRILNCCKHHIAQMHQRVSDGNNIFHSCPMGMIVRSENEDITKRNKHHTSIVAETCAVEEHEEPETNYSGDKYRNSNVRPCCERKVSWTEPRICRCNMSDITGTSKKCECECGARMKSEKHEKSKLERKKSVRFSDELTYIGCDTTKEKLPPQDTKGLCKCCQECYEKETEACVGKPVLVYELPEPKMEDKSVSRKDFRWHKVPHKEIPPWHPIVKERWNDLNVPSLSETTYQGDFKPPSVSILQRNPVYLAPRKEEKDLCKQLAEDFKIWKKTSRGLGHIHHSNCPKCDEDLHRVHLHECDISNLPVEYRCHGDGHIDDFNEFTLGETGDVARRSKKWWKRTCCQSGERNVLKSEGDATDSMKLACYQPETTYQTEFKKPEVIRKYSEESEKCKTRRLSSR